MIFKQFIKCENNKCNKVAFYSIEKIKHKNLISSKDIVYGDFRKVRFKSSIKCCWCNSPVNIYADSWKELKSNPVKGVLILEKINKNMGTFTFQARCMLCKSNSRLTIRELFIYKSKWSKGCKNCYSRRPSNIKPNKSGIRYGRNANGFIDRSIVIYEQKNNSELNK